MMVVQMVVVDSAAVSTSLKEATVMETLSMTVMVVSMSCYAAVVAAVVTFVSFQVSS